MPYDINTMLENDTHLRPLLEYYLQTFNPDLATKSAIDEEDWEYLPAPDGSISGFRLDVVAGGRSGAMNIRDGYLRALAHCLKNGSSPPSINIISIINHEQIHWTSSVAEIQISPNFIEQAKQFFQGSELKMLSINEIVNRLNAAYHPKKTAYQIEDDLHLIGAAKIVVKHYDSHNADPKKHKGPYYAAYKKSLKPLIDSNPRSSLEATKCKQQQGNTCGDNSLWNGFTAGVLKLSPEEELFQMDSSSLRTFSEHQVSDLEHIDEEDMIHKQVQEQIQENIALSRQMYEIPRSKIPTTQSQEMPARGRKSYLPKHVSMSQTPEISQPPTYPEQIHTEAFNKLITQFGLGKSEVKRSIEIRYKNQRTETGVKGFFQKINIKVGHVFKVKRKHQIEQLASVIDKLQKDKILNDFEKGIILKGVLDDIIDDITRNESTNLYQSRLLVMCRKMAHQLKGTGIPDVPKESKSLAKVYLSAGPEHFREMAKQESKKGKQKYK